MDEADAPGAVRSVRDIIAWQRSYALALSVAKAVKQFPSDERFALTSQVRRSAVSVPSNIAEGFGRGSRPDYIRFLYVARGSLYELSTQLSLACDLGYLPPGLSRELLAQADEAERVLWGLIRALERKN